MSTLLAVACRVEVLVSLFCNLCTYMHASTYRCTCTQYCGSDVWTLMEYTPTTNCLEKNRISVLPYSKKIMVYKQVQVCIKCLKPT